VFRHDKKKGAAGKGKFFCLKVAEAKRPISKESKEGME